MNLMIYLAFTAAAAAGISGLQLLRLRRSNAQLRALLELATSRAEFAETELAGVANRERALRRQLDQLRLRDNRLGGDRARPGLDQAIALSRAGADDAQLMSSCGLSRGEARLVRVLYGADEPAPTAAGLH